jgi:hypothetical protein
MGRKRPDLAQRNRERATHRMTHSRTWRAWASMRDRCTNESHPWFHRYGGRGISFCDTWSSFEVFLADMGVAPDGLSLDRIDNDGPYNKENCRWTSQREQSNNRSSNVVVSHNNKDLTVAQWAQQTGLERKTLEWRIRKGWSPERALTTPSLIPRKAV